MTSGTTAGFRAVFPEVGVGGLSRNDGTIEFYTRVRSLSRPRSVVLDFGAGRGQGVCDDPVAVRQELRTLRGDVAEVVGVDVDPAVLTNPGLDRAFVVSPEEPLPLAEESVDLIVSDFVFEHVADPHWAGSELLRVLRPGGWICARTPNRAGYVAIGARLVANGHHVSWLRVLQPTKLEQDTFPTRYLMNSPKQIRAAFPDCAVVTYTYDGPPQYGGNSKVAIRALQGLSRILPASLATTLLAFVHKPGRDAIVTPPGPPLSQRRADGACQ